MREIDQVLILASNVLHNTSQRFDCPLCAGKNTLSITKEPGLTLWNCFKAKCKLSGRKYSQMNSEAIKSNLENRTKREQLETWIIPEEIQLLELADEQDQVECIMLLRKYNALDAYKNSYCSLGYDLIRDRLVFFIKRNGEIYNATGRSLTNSQPKWWNYNNSNKNIPFLVENKGDILIIVEDCISACTVSKDQFTGMALLGSSINDLALSHSILKGYKKVVILLDNDATKKAIELHKKISPFVFTQFYLMKFDPKNMDVEDLKVLHERIKT